jgi:Ca2+-binding EF-hand superfamily protein
MDNAMLKAEMHRLEKLFHDFDENKDGRIDVHELTVGLKRMGYYHITEEQIEVSK